MIISFSSPQKLAQDGSSIRVMGSPTVPPYPRSLRGAGCSGVFVPARVRRQDFITLARYLFFIRAAGSCRKLGRWLNSSYLLFGMRGTVLRIFPSLSDRGYGVIQPSCPRCPANSRCEAMSNSDRQGVMQWKNSF